MIIHKDFKGDFDQLIKYSKMKNIKSIFQIVELVIKSYSCRYNFVTMNLKELLKVINNDSKILNNLIKEKIKKNKTYGKYNNILVMNKFIYYYIYHKSYINDEKNKKMLPKYKYKFKYYGKLFLKNNKKLNKDSEIIKDEDINKLLFNCKLA